MTVLNSEISIFRASYWYLLVFLFCFWFCFCFLKMICYFMVWGSFIFCNGPYVFWRSIYSTIGVIVTFCEWSSHFTIFHFETFSESVQSGPYPVTFWVCGSLKKIINLFPFSQYLFIFACLSPNCLAWLLRRCNRNLTPTAGYAPEYNTYIFVRVLLFE